MNAKPDPVAADHDFFAALVAANVASLDRILADDFMLIDVMSGSQVPRATLIDLVGSKSLVFEAIEPIETLVRVYETSAVVTGRTQMRGRFGEQPFSAASRYTHVFVWQFDRWRLVAAQGTQIVPPPAA
jgi:ketosteroid isomerase-like protein